MCNIELFIVHYIWYCVLLFLPVKMFLNASSTFVESNADVSINEMLFFSNVGREERYILNMYTVKYFTDYKTWLGLLHYHSAW